MFAKLCKNDLSPYFKANWEANKAYKTILIAGETAETETEKREMRKA